MAKPDSCDRTAASNLASWNEYVRQTNASIEKRAGSHDMFGAARVMRTHHSNGTLLCVDVSDWKGRPRAHVTHNASTGEVSEIRLISSKGEETCYNSDNFGTTSNLLTHLQKTQRCCAALSRNSSPQKMQAVTRSLEALCHSALLPCLERLVQREVDEGQQLVPPFEDLMEMDAETIVRLLDAA